MEMDGWIERWPSDVGRYIESLKGRRYTGRDLGVSTEDMVDENGDSLGADETHWSRDLSEARRLGFTKESKPVWQKSMGTILERSIHLRSRCGRSRLLGG